MRKRPRSKLTAIQTGLSDVLGEEKLEKLAGIARLRRAWPAMIGPVLAQHTEPINIESDTLLIAVDHPVMAQQIRFLQREIRDACFRKCHVSSIRRIRTRMQPGAGINSSRKPAIPVRSVGLSEKKRVAGILQHVSDKTLRCSMFDAYLAQLVYGRDETA
ncbi:MAG: DUF721 domain-containing protein [Mariprofundaceae bacterium]|nr:DUF721 domain-containing protein [Mariprofundaceae bacterium]